VPEVPGTEAQAHSGSGWSTDSLESDWLRDSDSLEDSLLWLDESLLEDELLDDELSEEELDEDEEDDDEVDEDDDEDSLLDEDESLEDELLLEELSQQRQSPWVGPNQRIRDPLRLGGTWPGSPSTDRSP
jgi:hypothetical protein